MALTMASGCGAGEIGGANELDDPSDPTGGAGGEDVGGEAGSGAPNGGGMGAATGGGGTGSMPLASGGGGASSLGGGGVSTTGGIGGGVNTGGSGPTGGTIVVPPATDTPPAGWKKTVVAVGYGGMRVASQDQGNTWTKLAQLTRDGGDDRELFRAVAYGKGRWVSAGWRMFTSSDGATWVEGKNPEGCGLMESAAYGHGVFVGACGDQAFLSDDGLAWRKGGRIGSNIGHTHVLFGNGTFAASGDSGSSYSSTDGKTWTSLPGIRKVRFCRGEMRSEDACAGDAWFPDTFYRGAWKGKLERSSDGASWKTTYTDDWENSVYNFGEGYLPPLK